MKWRAGLSRAFTNFKAGEKRRLQKATFRGAFENMVSSHRAATGGLAIIQPKNERFTTWESKLKKLVRDAQWRARINPWTNKLNNLVSNQRKQQRALRKRRSLAGNTEA